MDSYDAGLLGDGGGGDVGWWQDYIRMLLRQADDFYEMQHSQILTDLHTEELFRTGELAELRAKLSTQEAIVEKLPKTADGVPLIQPMQLWILDGYGRVRTGPYVGFDTGNGKHHVLVQDPNQDDWGWIIPFEDCYSTKELAQAAAEAARATEGSE